MSMIGVGRQHLSGALQGGMKATQLEQERNAANEQLEQAEKQQTISATTTGAGMGAAVGASYGSAGGPIGMAAGAVLGFLVGELF